MIEFISNIPFGVWVLGAGLSCIIAVIVAMIRDDAKSAWRRDLHRLEKEQRSRNFRDKL